MRGLGSRVECAELVQSLGLIAVHGIIILGFELIGGTRDYYFG